MAPKPPAGEWTSSKNAVAGTLVADAVKGRPANGPGEYREVAWMEVKGTTRRIAFTDGGPPRSMGVATKVFVAPGKPAKATDPEPVGKPTAAEAKAHRTTKARKEAALVAEAQLAHDVAAAAVADAPAPEADRLARNLAARAEHAALRDWFNAGATGDRPTTPNLDALNAAYGVPGPRQRATTARSTVTSTSVTAAGRAAPGAFLLRLVEWLDANPDRVVSPTELDKELGHGNTGAVANALERLATQGRARKVQDKPRRYQAPERAQAAATA